MRMMNRHRPGSPHDAGFALVEVLSAVLLISLAAASVADLCLTGARSVQHARVETVATVAATQKMEQLLGLAWAVDPTTPGSSTIDLTTDLSTDPPTMGGSGLGASPAGALHANLAGHVDYLDARGQWAGTGAAPMARAVFVRRWRVEPVPGSSGRLLAVHVFVTSAGRPGSPDEAAVTRHPSDVLLTTVRARKAL
jgi:hypothetical protein